jgi:dipeptidyl aminopeptidase/acylaminoacyl peptidase
MMSAWIVTQTPMFAAAISVSPATDQLSFHYTCNIGEFARLFFADDPAHLGGKYYSRSPVLFAHQAQTPTLNVAGLKDRCTPPTQALEFHRALVEAGAPSELVLYPLEGHGVRGFESSIDFNTRMIEWLERYVPGAAQPRIQIEEYAG